jgi:hypothetical protein
VTILSEIKTALSVVGMENFSSELKEYSDKAFGNYVVELTDGFNRLELVCDRGQVFMEIWDFKKNQFVACTDLFPEMEKVYTSNLNEVGLGEWTIEDVFRSYNEVTQSRT